MISVKLIIRDRPLWNLYNQSERKVANKLFREVDNMSDSLPAQGIRHIIGMQTYERTK